MNNTQILLKSHLLQLCSLLQLWSEETHVFVVSVVAKFTVICTVCWKIRIVTMADANEFPARHSHIAIRMENCIIVFGGVEMHCPAVSPGIIWMYNLYTEQWGKHVIQDTEKLLSRTIYPYAARIEADIFMFGGYDLREDHHTNAVWKLTRTPE